ncbi:MAG TPA: prenyltransferase [Glaciibacter sp.]|nr:prenyltransferase [Glaciibacter sp.]
MIENRSTLGWKAGQLVLSSRPLSWINTAFPFAAAYVVTTGDVDALLVVGTLFFLVPYNLLMYGINDVFDYESDLRNPRKGGAEGALLDPGLHRAVMVTGVVLAVPFLVVMLILAGTEEPLSWLVLAVSLFAVAAYSVPGLRFKERPFLDSATSSTHFVSPAVYGLAVAGAVPTPGLVATLAAFFLWGMASHAFGAVQDVTPDREAGIASIATVLGAARTVRLAIGLWAAAGILMLFTEWPGPLAAFLAVPYIATAFPYRSVPDDRSEAANAGWKRFLWINYACGFVVTLILIAWVMGSAPAA